MQMREILISVVLSLVQRMVTPVSCFYYIEYAAQSLFAME